MSKYYWFRIIVALVAIAFSLACSAILDTDTLKTEPAEDSSVEGDILPGDLGSCQPGKSCAVAGMKGLCAVGKSVCFEAGTGTCQQVVKPTTEKCDGKDSDCDGKADKSDAHAHAWCKQENDSRADTCSGSACKCGTKAICAAGHTCSSGTCKCGTGAACTMGHTCSNGTCKCGTKAKCAQPNPRCSSGKCVCDANSTCKTNEKCDGGVCNCGTEKGPDEGPFCNQGTCNAQTGKCDGIPTDIGPDGPVPDVKPTVDMPPPDTQPTPDAPTDTTPTPDSEPTPDTEPPDQTVDTTP